MCNEKEREKSIRLFFYLNIYRLPQENIDRKKLKTNVRNCRLNQL